MTKHTRASIRKQTEELYARRRRTEEQMDRAMLELKNVDTMIKQLAYLDSGGYWQTVDGDEVPIRTLTDSHLESAMRACMVHDKRPVSLALLAAEGARRNWDIQDILTSGACSAPPASLTRDLPFAQDSDPTLLDATQEATQVITRPSRPATSPATVGVIDLVPQSA